MDGKKTYRRATRTATDAICPEGKPGWPPTGPFIHQRSHLVARAGLGLLKMGLMASVESHVTMTAIKMMKYLVS